MKQLLNVSLESSRSNRIFLKFRINLAATFLSKLLSLKNSLEWLQMCVGKNIQKEQREDSLRGFGGVLVRVLRVRFSLKLPEAWFVRSLKATSVRYPHHFLFWSTQELNVFKAAFNFKWDHFFKVQIFGCIGSWKK